MLFLSRMVLILWVSLAVRLATIYMTLLTPPWDSRKAEIVDRKLLLFRMSFDGKEEVFITGSYYGSALALFMFINMNEQNHI